MMQSDIAELDILPEFPVPKATFDEEGSEGFRKFVIQWLSASQRFSQVLSYALPFIRACSVLTHGLGCILVYRVNALSHTLRVRAFTPSLYIAEPRFISQSIMEVVSHRMTSGYYLSIRPRMMR